MSAPGSGLKLNRSKRGLRRHQSFLSQDCRHLAELRRASSLVLARIGFRVRARV
jgi:hypothetical protein